MDIIACSDNLTGMSEAIQFNYALIKLEMFKICFIKLVADLKPIYSACSEEQAMQALESFESKWNKQYPQITKSWYKNWDNLMVFKLSSRNQKSDLYKCYWIC
ncbi:hypothetical protein SHM_22070 [Spiroplasma ixodetis]|uniref:Mutator family transposase n=1 Tax=Spiroplasma ixodetis TaxID=2141 RepID=A0ABM8BXE7_9MOLU|nr:transposase [Spiroplasma ixodetis]BDT04561.1 hypothetical protein SHM_22070 [Spiroplasma ixodetis]